MSDKKRETEELRQEMARIDAQLLAALDRRAKLSRRVGELRRGEPPQPAHDRSALAALVARSSGDMPQESLRAVFREIFATSAELELPARVAFVGPEGGAGHVAARARFGAAAELLPAEGVLAALDEVTRQRADFAVVPIETKGEGPVQATILALTHSDLKIVSAIESAATLHLMNRTGNQADIEKVYATSHDRAACQRFLAAHPQRVSVLDVKSPLFACQIAAEDHGAAALVSEEFGAPLGLIVARRNVTDEVQDRVRYAVVGSRPSSRSGEDVTAFVFSVQDTPGALLDVLRHFSERGINVLKIQSHPEETEGGTGWAYLFFVEVSGHPTDRQLVVAFEEVKRVSRFFKVLGAYPNG